MEAVAELAQRIGAIKGFAIGASDRRHGFPGLHNEMCFADCICANFAACDSTLRKGCAHQRATDFARPLDGKTARPRTGNKF